MKIQTAKKSIKKKELWLYEISNSITEPKKLLKFLCLEKNIKYFDDTPKKDFPL